MGVPLKRLGRIIDSEEFSDWMAYSRIEPFGPRRDDERAGVIAAIIAEVYRDRKVRSEPFHWTDFFPPHRSTISPVASAGPTQDQLYSKIIAWAAVMNKANQGQTEG